MWYTLLLAEPYVQAFCAADAVATAQLQAYKDEIILPITLANTIASFEKVQQTRALHSLSNKKTYDLICDFLSLCHYEPVNFSQCFRTSREKTPAEMTEEELAVRIMYPFWSRMGGSFEQAFYASGELRIFLQHLSTRCSDI